MKLISYIYITPLFFLCISCSIEGSFQGLLSYRKITEKKNNSLLKESKNYENNCLIKYSDTCKVLVFNGKDLLDCLEKKDRSIVYLWSAHCKGKSCYFLDRFQVLADSMKASLYIVADYYDVEFMEMYYNIDNPIIGIDTKYYKSNFTHIYVKKFFEDMGVRKEVSERIIYFEKGIYKESCNVIEDLSFFE